MVEKYVFEAKTEDEAITLAQQELNIEKNDMYYQSDEVESGKLFKSKKIKVSVYKKDDIIKYIKNFVSELSKDMDLPIQCEIRVEADNIQIQLFSDNNGILIGKEGRTMNAIQTLLKQSLKEAAQISLKISVDVGNYKLKKMKNIEREVKELAKEVEKSHLEVSLDPMNSYERRLVHNIINEYSNLETESFGDGKDRPYHRKNQG